MYCDGGSDRSVHGGYFGNYTDVAVDFIIKKFNESMEDGGGSGANESSSATGSPTPSATATTSTSCTPSPTSTTNAAASQQPSGILVTAFLGLVAACVALF